MSAGSEPRPGLPRPSPRRPGVGLRPTLLHHAPPPRLPRPSLRPGSARPFPPPMRVGPAGAVLVVPSGPLSQAKTSPDTSHRLVRWARRVTFQEVGSWNSGDNQNGENRMRDLTPTP